MVALKGKAITDFVARRNPNIHAVLIYGPDQGLVRERIEKIALQVVPDLNDPFNTIEISESELKANPTRLTDEITALSFMGGERIIRYRANGEAAGDGVSNFIKNLDSGDYQPNGVVIISGGELSPRSSLRKLFEKSKNSAALPCYIDGPQAVRTLAQSMAQEQGLEFERHALDFVTMTLGEDRALTRSELEKLILYKSPGKQQNSQSSTITIDDVKASLALCMIAARIGVFACPKASSGGRIQCLAPIMVGLLILNPGMLSLLSLTGQIAVCAARRLLKPIQHKSALALFGFISATSPLTRSKTSCLQNSLIHLNMLWADALKTEKAIGAFMLKTVLMKAMPNTCTALLSGAL